MLAIPIMQEPPPHMGARVHTHPPSTPLRTPYLLVQIGSLGVARGHCGMVPQEQVMHWGTDDFTAPDHHSVPSGNLHP